MIGGVTLRSGSSGNSTLIRNGDLRLVVDCGINGKTFTNALAEIGESPTDIAGILITHEHSDHVSGLGVVLRKYKIPFYITHKTFKKILPRLGKFDNDLVNIIKVEDKFLIKDQLIESFQVPHDAVETLAYRFMTDRGDITVCTDIGSIDPEIIEKIKKSRLIFLESNYDLQLLRNGPYPQYLKERISNGHGHLSNGQCSEALCELVEKGTEQIVLVHLSEDNNHPAIAELTSKQALEEIDAIQNHDYLLQVAKRHQTSNWMHI
ncbi:MAG TPA: MBL fold metallo-hydrolase [Candidatus Eisenbacteria bacterium]|nr:MBL fold metallo-hydrolase [Candidatus Eisenbacteria bacterium]